jgi:dTMP kinase
MGDFMSNGNYFISFEGMDKSGKTTMINMLKQRFPEWKYHSDPSYNALNGELREYLLYGKKTPESEFLGFLFARSIEADVIAKELEEGYTVVCDRWIDSTTAYQGYYRDWYSKIGREVFKVMNKIAVLGFEETEDFYGVIPDLTIFIDIPISECKKRAKKEVTDKFDREFANVSANFGDLHKGYAFLAKHENRIKTVDGFERTKENMFNEILKLLYTNGIINQGG